MNLREWNTFDLYSKVLRTVCFTIGRLGVPIFIFLSGALILSKNIDDDLGVMYFYKHNLLPLFISVEIWNVIYIVFLATFTSGHISIRRIIKTALFMEKVYMPHMWYIPMILGMYLAIPFISIIIKRITIKTLYIPMIIVIISSFVIPNVNQILSSYGKQAKECILYLDFCGGVYGIYLLIGYFISKNILKNLKTYVNLVLFIIFFLATVYFQIWVINRGVSYNVWYDFIGLLLCTVFLFELFSRICINSRLLKNVSYKISSISLGIFFVHKPIQMILCKYIVFGYSCKLVSILLIWIITLVLSIVLVLVLSNIEIFKKWLFIIK